MRAQQTGIDAALVAPQHSEGSIAMAEKKAYMGRNVVQKIIQEH